MTIDENAPLPAPGLSRSAGALRRFFVWMLIGLGVGMIGMFFVLLVLVRDPTPALTPEIFHAAHNRWNRSAPKNYNIEIRVTGSQPAVYRVEVRDGQAQAAWRNGSPLLQRRTFGTWSVPGMVGTIGRDIEAVEKHAAGKADPFTPRLTLRAEFDPKYSYPAKYRRIEWGSSVEVAWEVTQFTALP
jgi:hypothetical protein